MTSVIHIFTGTDVNKLAKKINKALNDYDTETNGMIRINELWSDSDAVFNPATNKTTGR